MVRKKIGDRGKMKENRVGYIHPFINLFHRVQNVIQETRFPIVLFEGRRNTGPYFNLIFVRFNI